MGTDFIWLEGHAFTSIIIIQPFRMDTRACKVGRSLQADLPSIDDLAKFFGRRRYAMTGV